SAQTLTEIQLQTNLMNGARLRLNSSQGCGDKLSFARADLVNSGAQALKCKLAALIGIGNRRRPNSATDQANFCALQGHAARTQCETTNLAQSLQRDVQGL